MSAVPAGRDAGHAPETSAATAPGPGRLRPGLRHLASRQRAVHVLGAAIVVSLVITGVLAPWLAPRDPLAQDVTIRLLPPVSSLNGTWQYPLGTDQLGRDVLSRLIYGSRITLLVGFFSVVIGGLIGILGGLASGYLGGVCDIVIMGIADAQLAFPFILLALAVMAALGPGLRNVIIVLSATGWVVFARLVRGITLSVKEKDFVEAARACGADSVRIMRGHVMPYVLSPVIVLANLQLGALILAEAALSFLGVGINPPTPTWGNMISDGRNYMWDAPLLSVLPGVALILSVLGFTYFGDWLRMTLDPKSRSAQR
jgi:peptide/nickel transport system permease protein